MNFRVNSIDAIGALSKFWFMFKCGNPTSRDVVAVHAFIPVRLRWLLTLIVTGFFLFAAAAPAADADAQYIQIYGLIEQADELSTSGKAEQAKAKYVEAEKALKALRQNYPNWNVKLVGARMNYLAGKIATLSQPVPVEPSPEVSAQKSAAPVVKPVVPGQPQVKLLEAGAEPHQVFRLQAKPMSMQKSKLTAKFSMGMSAPEMPGEMMKMPAISMKSVLTPKSVSAAGEVNYEIVIEDVEVVAEPGVAAQLVDGMKQSLAGMKGLVLVGTMTDRYLTKKIEVKIPAGTDAQTREGMEQMKDSFANSEFILPEEAIGVGAKWEVKEKTKEQGMTIDQTTRHELVSIEGGVLVIKSSTTQSAANQKIPNPIMPTLKADLTKMTGSATGTSTVDLTKILPIKTASDVRSEVNMTMNNAGKKQAMTVKTETHGTMESD
jgi:hypothetical protein